MALVNQALPGLYGGVSQQDSTLRHDTQVSEMINCYPTIIGGVQKRPPTMIAFNDDTFPTDAFIYAYDRGAGNEQYIIAINSISQYRVFDIITNNWITEWTTEAYLQITDGAIAKDSFSMTTVGDTSFIVNKTRDCGISYNAAATEPTISQRQILDTYSLSPQVSSGYGAGEAGDYYETYTLSGYITCSISIVIGGITKTFSYTSPAINQTSGVGTARGTNFTGEYDVSSAIQQALYKFAYVDTANSDNNITITGDRLQTLQIIGDTTVNVSFVGTGSLNGTHRVLDYDESGNWEDIFYYWVKRTAGAADSVNQPLRYTYYIYNGVGAVVGSVVGHDSTVVASALATAIGGISQGSVVRKEITDGTIYSGADSWGNQASEAWQGQVKKLADLPTDLGYAGAVFELTGDENTNFDNYYVKYDGSVYKETVRPNLSNYIDPTTMPHKIELRRLTDTPTYHISFDIIDWEERKVGDDLSASAPSFIGQPIQDAFFYRNRLGFISGDNVILSESGNYYNFWPTTVTDVLDSDMIDVAVDSNKAISLRYATPFNKELLIFGDKAQFVMSASDSLTPTNVSVQQSTAFDIKAVTPVVIGPNAYFAIEKNTFSGIREYYVQPDSLSNDAADITAHCPNYIPANITKLVGSSKNDMLFAISSDTPDTIYVYNFYWQGEEKAQSAWHKWTFGGDIFNIDVIGSSLLVMIERNGTVTLETMPLEYVLDTTAISYNDNVSVAYESKIVLTKPGFVTGNTKVDDTRGTFVMRNLKVNADYGSLYNVAAYRFNRPREYFYNNGIGQYPSKGYISSKEYNYRSSAGVLPGTALYPATTLYPGAVTYIMSSDHKYSVMGNVNNLEIVFTNSIAAGFRINSLDLAGTYVKSARNV